MTRLTASHVFNFLAQISMFLSRSAGCLIVSLLLLCTVGCQQRTAAKLLGEWVGRSDTAAAKAQREAKKYGDKPSADQISALQEKPETVTDWQQYDIKLKFHFVSRTQLEMSLADGTEPRSGTWQVLETSPSGCTIEVESATGPEQSAELRQFQLEIDEHEGTLVGFLLTELGADSQLGALYFRRPDSTE